MATIHERLTLFYAARPGFRFGKKKHGFLCNIIKLAFDKRDSEYFKDPSHYVLQEADGEEYNVRNYPPTFIPTIDGLITKLHAEHIKNTKRKRKRIPLKSSVYNYKKTGTNGNL